MTAGRKAATGSRDWCTPPEIVSSVRRVFGTIDLDPCSNRNSLVGADVEYIPPERDGLRDSWDFKRIYVNPPYGFDRERGTQISHWFARMTEAAARGSEVIALVPVATNTWHWKIHVYPVASAICFLYSSRLKFHIDGAEDPRGAPMSCAVIYYGDRAGDFAEEFSRHGAVLPLDGAVLPEAPLTLF